MWQLHERGYKLADSQASLTPLQRLFIMEILYLIDEEEKLATARAKAKSKG